MVKGRDEVMGGSTFESRCEQKKNIYLSKKIKKGCIFNSTCYILHKIDYTASFEARY